MIMITCNNVRGTMEQVITKEENYGNIYIRTNIIRIDEEGENGFHGWQYDEQQFTSSEYTAVLESEITRLTAEDLNNKEALIEIYETIMI